MDSSSSRRFERGKILKEVVSLWCTTALGTSDVEELQECLFDTWSEIRNDSAKCLMLHQAAFPDDVRVSVLDALLPTVELASVNVDDEDRGGPWQKVHGAMLGLNAIMRGDIGVVYVERLKSVCISLQGHTRLPVRDEVRKCLLRLFHMQQKSAEQVQIIDLILSSLSSCLSKKQSGNAGRGSSSSPSSSSSGVFTFQTLSLSSGSPNRTSQPSSPSARIRSDGSPTSKVRQQVVPQEEERLAYTLDGLMGSLEAIFDSLPSLQVSLKFKGYYSILVVPCFMWSGAFDRYDLLLSHPVLSLASPMTIILIFTLKHTSCLNAVMQGLALTEDGHDAGEDGPLGRILGLLERGVGDSSSTVRQSAGQTLIKMISRCKGEEREGTQITEITTENTAVEAVKAVRSFRDRIFGMLTQQFAKRGADRWRQHEICLLVAEDVIRTALEERLGVLGQLVVRTECDTVFAHFCADVQDVVQFGLLHNMFEIRRMATQVLPSLVRYLVVFEPARLFKPNAPWSILADDSQWSADWVQSRKEGQLHLREEFLLQGLVAFAWVAEVVKATQHVKEVLLKYNGRAPVGASGLDRRDKDKEKEKDRPIDKAYSHSHHFWAMEVQGRLAEDEAKARFHNGLRQCLNSERFESLSASGTSGTSGISGIGSSTRAATCAAYLSGLLGPVRETVGKVVTKLSVHWQTMNAERIVDSAEMAHLSPSRVNNPAPASVKAEKEPSDPSAVADAKSQSKPRVNLDLRMDLSLEPVTAPYQPVPLEPVFLSLDYVEAISLGCALLEDLRQEGVSLDKEELELLRTCPWIEAVHSSQLLLARCQTHGHGQASASYDALRALTETETSVYANRPGSISTPIPAAPAAGTANNVNVNATNTVLGKDVVVILSVSDPTVEPHVLFSSGPGSGGSVSSIGSPDSLGSGVSASLGLISSNSASASMSMRTLVAANRWMCEHVGPVLPVFLNDLNVIESSGEGEGKGESATGNSNSSFFFKHTHDHRLSLITAQWVFSLVKDPLWLDRRPNVRRGLFNSLVPSLTQFATKHTQGRVSEGEGKGVGVGRWSEGALAALAQLYMGAVKTYASRFGGQQRALAVESSEVSALMRSCRLLLQTDSRVVLPVLCNSHSQANNNNDSGGGGSGSLQQHAGSIRKVLEQALQHSQAGERIGLTSPWVSPAKVNKAAIDHTAQSRFTPTRSVLNTDDVCKVLLMGDQEDSDSEIVGWRESEGANSGAGAVIKAEEGNFETDDFSDWDEESDDELNVSSNSVHTMQPVDVEITSAMQEIDSIVSALVLLEN